MKNKKMIKLLTVLFFGTLVVTGCSCTNSMCTEQDLTNIRNQIEETNINEWRTKFSQEEGKDVYPDEFDAYYETYKVTGSLTKSELADQIESDNPGVDYTDESKDYVATRTDAFQSYVDENVNALYEKHPKACLTVTGETDPETGAKLETKTWKDAWKTGLLEGFIVFPLSWLLSTLSTSFGATGAAHLLAIVIVVFIIRVLMLVLGFKGQVNNMKMQEIQPEIQKLQAKFTDPKTSDAEKQVLSSKMMAIYKENNISPFSGFLTIFIQFPIFIAVWAAMNQTVTIRSGEFLGLEFGTPLNEQIFSGTISSISASVLFLLMIGAQILTMKMPNIIRWYKEKKNPTPEYKKNDEKNSTQKQMNTMMIMMIVMVVLSAFVLPAALVIYWVVGSVFSIIQTLIFSLDSVKAKLKTLSHRKKKVKIVR